MLNQLGNSLEPTAIEGRESLMATIFSGVWLVGLAAYAAGFFGLFGGIEEPRGAVFLEIILFILAAIVPIFLIWTGVLLLRRTTEVQRDARDLATAIKRMQTDPMLNRSARVTPAGSDKGMVETRAKLDALGTQMAQVESALVALLQAQVNATEAQATAPASRNSGPIETTTTDPNQGNLALGAREVAPSQQAPEWIELVQALNFPTDEKDKDGFRALRIAMRHRNTSQCLRAAEDIMNLMAQDGIYTDDLKPEIAPAALWRKFADGTRGEEVAAIGGIHDVTSIALIRGRMRSDQIFRDTALHFQRRFDIVLNEFCAQASDSHIEALADTRTARTFMLLGRVSGMFG
ncbi:MAG: hypothetical protein JKY31_05185 [Rhodobacteraceae bacterium]|nr:hypothetical protein [Paracoccaceae bacterium]